MSVDISFDKKAFSVSGTEGKRYFALFEEVGCNNVRMERTGRIARDWSYLYFGSYRRCLARIMLVSSSCEISMLQHASSSNGNGYRPVTPEGYITAWKKALGAASTLPVDTELRATIDPPRTDADMYARRNRYESAARAKRQSDGQLGYLLNRPDEADAYAASVLALGTSAPWDEVSNTAWRLAHYGNAFVLPILDSEKANLSLALDRNDIDAQGWVAVKDAQGSLVNRDTRETDDDYAWIAKRIRRLAERGTTGDDPISIIRQIRKAYAQLPEVELLDVLVEGADAPHVVVRLGKDIIDNAEPSYDGRLWLRANGDQWNRYLKYRQRAVRAPNAEVSQSYPAAVTHEQASLFA